MILRILKSNQAYHFVLIPLIVLILWFRSFISPEFFPFFEGENKMPLYGPLNGLLSEWPLVNNVLAVLLVILLSFLVLRLNTVYDFIQIRTFLPSNIFVLIVSGLVSLHTLHPVYFGAVFLMLCINRIFDAYANEKVYSNAFDSGFFLAVGSLFYINLIFYFPVIWIGFLLLRRNREWRDFVMSLVGLFLPWLFAFSWYFLRGSLDQFREVIVQNLATSNSFLRDNNAFLVYLGLLTLITLWSSLFLLGQYGAKNISARKYFQIFFVIFLISFVMFFLIPAASHEILVLMAIPLTFLISNYLIAIKSQFWGNLFIIIFLGLIVYMQFI